MNLLVLGASGGVGRWLCTFAAKGGHEVTALVRRSTPFEPPTGVRVVRGDALDRETLDTAVAGQDAVASCLGLRRAGKSPFAQLLSPPDLMQRVAELLVQLLPAQDISRLVAVSAGGAGDSIEQLTWPVKKLVSTGNVAVSYRDLAEMERILAASDLDWMAVRPVTLTDGEPTGRAKPVERYKLASMIRRSDVAAWMLKALEQEGPFSERTVLLGT